MRIDVLADFGKTFVEHPLPFLNLLLRLFHEKLLVIAYRFLRVFGLLVVHELGTVNLKILKGRHQHFHSLLYLVDQLILLVHPVSFVRAKQGAGFANADLAVDAVQLPWLIVLEADLVGLNVVIDFLGAVVILLSEEFLTRIRFHNERIIALRIFRISVKPKSATGLITCCIYFRLTTLRKETFEWNGVNVVIGGACFPPAWECVIGVVLGILLVLKPLQINLIDLLLFVFNDLVEGRPARTLALVYLAKLIATNILQLQQSIVD